MKYNTGNNSLKLIADECGAAVSTVSRALAEPPSRKVGAETIRRIRECALRHGCAGNPNARSLRLRRTESITLVVPPFFTLQPLSIDFDAHSRVAHWELIFGVIQTARRHNYDVKLEPLDSNDLRELERKMNPSRCDGAIFLGSKPFEPLLEALRSTEFPHVVIEFSSTSRPAPVHLALEPGYREAVVCLKRAGRNRIGLFAESEHSHPGAIRTVLERILERSADGWFRRAGTVLDLRRAVESGMWRDFDAIFCQNDAMAHVLAQELAAAGIPAAERPEVIGFDNNPVYNSLSTVAVPRAAMAEAAVELLVNFLKCGEPSPAAGTTAFPTTFIGRNSW